MNSEKFLETPMSQVNETSTSTWREKLNEWRRDNAQAMPEDLRQLREEFVRRFPKERLGEMTLEQYAVGTGSNDSFSYWLEFKTRRLGSISGGSAAKHGVWWDKKDGAWRWNKFYDSAEDALARIKGGLVALVKAVEEGRFGDLDRIGEQQLGQWRFGLRTKPLYLYFPDQFLPMSQPEHVRHFLKAMGVEPRGEILALNRQLLRLLHDLPEFEGFDTRQMMMFLYDNFSPPSPRADNGGDAPKPTPPPASAPHRLERLMNSTARTRNVLLYGPPGVGKTWLVNHFTNYFLLRHNVSKEAASEYWAAVINKEADARRALQSLVRGDGEPSVEQPNFWWITANQKIWSWKTLFERGEEVFHKRRIAKNFEEARPGDLIFGYFSGPQMQVVALARVTGELAMYFDRDVGGELEGILIEPVAELQYPLSYRAILENEILRQSEPIRNRAQGTLFRLTAEEAQELARMLNEEGNNVKLPTDARGDFAEFVTFHQSFAYEEFVEGLKPVAPEDVDEVTGEPVGDITYRVLPGVFRRICARAEAAWRTHGEDAPKYLLVVDEINRANIAKVLGELITLIEDDKRLGQENQLNATLPYSGERFGVPPNLYILGTMNTADRSIALLDLALRRRFTFVEMEPEPSAIEPGRAAGVDLRALLAGLNERVAALLDRDHRIGHSYLMNLTDEPSLRFAWYARVVPLLQEYFYNDDERLLAVLGPRFVRRTRVSRATAAALGELYDAEQPPHEVARLEGADFLEALRELAGGVRAAGAEAEENLTPEEAGTED
jgi:predicted RNA-binding protein with PUA-like domain